MITCDHSYCSFQLLGYSDVTVGLGWVAQAASENMVITTKMVFIKAFFVNMIDLLSSLHDSFPFKIIYDISCQSDNLR
jgi:hypothetical protein